MHAFSLAKLCSSSVLPTHTPHPCIPMPQSQTHRQAQTLPGICQLVLRLSLLPACLANLHPDVCASCIAQLSLRLLLHTEPGRSSDAVWCCACVCTAPVGPVTTFHYQVPGAPPTRACTCAHPLFHQASITGCSSLTVHLIRAASEQTGRLCLVSKCTLAYCPFLASFVLS